MKSLIPYSDKNTLIDTPEVYETYSKYFIKVLEAYFSKGLEVNYLTLQNEPLFGDSQTYPGMYLPSDKEFKLFQYLAPMLTTFNRANNQKVRVLTYDHNWDHPEYPLDFLTKSAAVEIDPNLYAVAWHCYGGDMAPAHEAVHDKFPTAIQHVTECTGSFPDDTCDINRGMESFGWNHEWDMSNIFLGAVSHWAVSGVKWILALDENCGPILPMVGYTFGRPLVSIPSYAKTESDIKFNQDYWTVGHMSKFVAKGSHRVTSSVENDSKKLLLTESFVDDSTGLTTTMVLNYDHANSVSFQVSDGSTTFDATIPPFSTMVYRW
jgi:glucosylceramidase